MPRPLSARTRPDPASGAPPGVEASTRDPRRGAGPDRLDDRTARPLHLRQNGPAGWDGETPSALAPRPERRYLGPVLALFAVLEAKLARRRADSQP